MLLEKSSATKLKTKERNVQNLLLQGDGTLNHWIHKTSGINLLFKKQDVQIGNETFTRGGISFSCSTLKDYLPGDEPIWSGDVRVDECQGSLLKPEKGYEEGEYFQATYLEPWKHQVTVTLSRKDIPAVLRHTLSVQMLETFSGKAQFTCVHIWLQPYFATLGKPFTIKHGNVVFSTNSKHDFTSPTFIRQVRNEPLFLHVGHGTIVFSLEGGGYYERYCIWSDCTRKYICIAPVLGHGKTLTMRHDEKVCGVYEMRYIPGS